MSGSKTPDLATARGNREARSFENACRMRDLEGAKVLRAVAARLVSPRWAHKRAELITAIQLVADQLRAAEAKPTSTTKPREIETRINDR